MSRLVSISAIRNSVEYEFRTWEQRLLAHQVPKYSLVFIHSSVIFDDHDSGPCDIWFHHGQPNSQPLGRSSMIIHRFAHRRSQYYCRSYVLRHETNHMGCESKPIKPLYVWSLTLHDRLLLLFCFCGRFLCKTVDRVSNELKLSAIIYISWPALKRRAKRSLAFDNMLKGMLGMVELCILLLAFLTRVCEFEHRRHTSLT